MVIKHGRALGKEAKPSPPRSYYCRSAGETHRSPVGVAGEVDLCGSGVNVVAGLSARVVQDQLVPHVAEPLVGQSCTEARR